MYPGFYILPVIDSGEKNLLKFTIVLAFSKFAVATWTIESTLKLQSML